MIDLTTTIVFDVKAKPATILVATLYHTSMLCDLYMNMHSCVAKTTLNKGYVIHGLMTLFLNLMCF